jgi:8-oxo-dGTP pyrophosphatase MutT (NUDIX family)
MTVKLKAAHRLFATEDHPASATDPLDPVRLLLTEDDIADAEKQGLFVPPLHNTEYWKACGAGALVLALDTMKVLLGKRGTEVADPGVWSTFGGTVNGNETPKKAMLRELNEETGLPGGTPFNAGHTNGAHGVYPLLTYRDMDRGFVYYNFLVVVDKQYEPKLNWESDGAEWFVPGQWPSPLHPGVECLINDKVSMDTLKYHMQQGAKQHIIKPRIQTKGQQ